MKPIDKSKRRIPRKVTVYPTLEAAVEAKLVIVRKQLEGVDLSFLERNE